MMYEDEDDVPQRSTLWLGVFKKIVFAIIILDVLAMLWFLTRR